MYKLDHLAQVCYDKGGFESDNLVFSRRITRSMNNVSAILGPMANQQDTQPTAIHIEDDIPSSIPNTTQVNSPDFIKDNGVKLGKAEVAQSCMNTCIVDPEPSFISPHSSGQNIDDSNSPQVDNNEETLQQVLDKTYQNKITELKDELKHCQSNAALIEEENRTFREELLSWISRWKKVNTKNQYKREKRSIIDTNQHLLKQIEKQKLNIIRLKAKLTEARRGVDLQSRN